MNRTTKDMVWACGCLLFMSLFITALFLVANCDTPFTEPWAQIKQFMMGW